MSTANWRDEMIEGLNGMGLRYAGLKELKLKEVIPSKTTKSIFSEKFFLKKHVNFKLPRYQVLKTLRDFDIQAVKLGKFRLY